MNKNKRAQINRLKEANKMKQEIIQVLKRYEGTQLNIDSEVAQNQIADEIADNINRKYIVTPVEHTHNPRGWAKDGADMQGWSNGEGWVQDSTDFDG